MSNVVCKVVESAIGWMHLEFSAGTLSFSHFSAPFNLFSPLFLCNSSSCLILARPFLISFTTVNASYSSFSVCCVAGLWNTWNASVYAESFSSFGTGRSIHTSTKRRLVATVTKKHRQREFCSREQWCSWTMSLRSGSWYWWRRAWRRTSRWMFYDEDWSHENEANIADSGGLFMRRRGRDVDDLSFWAMKVEALWQNFTC